MPGSHDCLDWAGVRTQVSGGGLKWATSDPGTTTLPNNRLNTSGEFNTYVKNLGTNPIATNRVMDWNDMLTYRKLQTSNYALHIGSSSSARSNRFDISTNSFCYEMWVRFTDTSFAAFTNYMAFEHIGFTQIDVDPDTGDPIYEASGVAAGIRYVSGTEVDWFFVYNNSSAAFQTSQTTSPAPALNTWYHLAYTYDITTNVQKLYLDGTAIISLTNGVDRSHDNSGTAGYLYLGASPNYGGSAGLVDIDEVRVWSVNRTQTEIQNNKSLHLVGNETNLLRYWRLENALTSDRSGTTDTITATGTTSFITTTPF
jgi:hypothetical protein